LPLQSSSGLPCVGLAQSGASVTAVLPAVIEAVDVSGNLLGFASATNTTLTMPDDAGLTDLAFNGAWSTATTDQILDVINAPDAGGVPMFAYSEIADGILSPLPSSAPPADAGASALMIAQTHVGFAAGVQAEALWLSYPPAGGIEGTSLITSAAAPTQSGTVTIDAAPLSTALSFLTAMTTTGASPAQPGVQWSLASGDLGGATGLVTSVGWHAAIDGGFQNGNWTIVSPGTTGTTLTVPALPASLAGYAPVTGAISTVNEIFAVYGQTSIPGYAALLPIGGLFPVQQCTIGAPAVPPLPGPGTAIVVGFSPGSGC
jgi:hypothetical protein